MISVPRVIASEAPADYSHKIPLLAPLSGKVHDLRDVYDPALQAGMWGDGVALTTRSSACVAPFDGVIESIDLTCQRWVLKSKNGLRVMIQLGQPQSSLMGERLQLQRKARQRCQTGQILCYLDPVWLSNKLGDWYCVVTILNEKGIECIVPAFSGSLCESMDELMTVYLKPVKKA